MEFPSRLKEKISEDTIVQAYVSAALVDFEPWLKDAKLPFFPDYTDHGTGHVEDILTTASSLIRDEAWEVMTPQDAGILFISTLLHDCAMHLSEDGFFALIADGSSNRLIKGFGDVDWQTLWKDFLFSVKRFDDNARTAIFGEAIPITDIPSSPLDLTLAHRLLIGEFIRRHHPRMAHEIAVHGVPGPTDRPIKLSEKLNPRLADIAGLIARSHGLSIRTALDRLDSLLNYDRHVYQNVHIIFLMVVLRTADYVQIQAERAPKQMLQIKKIRSPISKREWDAHHAVTNIHANAADPEALVIQAEPEDVVTYLRLKEWLTGIQDELDTSWAVLGEVYAPARLSELGLVIRRVRSNLDDEKKFAKSVPYVPESISFKVARSEILKLLIGPLYGDSPSFGIRELLQNSVDAVQELWDLQKQNPELKKMDLIDQKADVVIWVDEPDESGRAWVTVSDRGVGMTEKIVKEYFFNVGASYRRSEAWSKQHETTDDDENDQIKSRVCRSGRFGVGVLAAFLLGDEIEVETRHVSAEQGIRFRTGLQTSNVELRYDASLKVGTTIRIPITPETYEWFEKETEWDWYSLSKPKVQRLAGRKMKKLPQVLTTPLLSNNLPDDWNQIISPLYKGVFYQFPASYITSTGYSLLTCNGIRISGPDFWSTGNAVQVINKAVNRRLNGMTKFNDHLRISVFDPDSNLPLNLARSTLSAETGFEDELLKDITKLFFSVLLLEAGGTRDHLPKDQEMLGWTKLLEQRYRLSAVPVFYTPDGLSILETWNIAENCSSPFILFNRPDYSSDYSATSGLQGIILRGANHNRVSMRTDAFHSTNDYEKLEVCLSILEGRLDNKNLTGFDINPNGSRLLLVKQSSRFLTPEILAREGIREEWSNSDFSLLVTGSPPPTVFDTNYINKYLKTYDLYHPDVAIIAAEWYFSPGENTIEPSGLAKEWKNIFGGPVIPFDEKIRRETLAHAYEVLAPYLKRLESQYIEP